MSDDATKVVPGGPRSRELNDFLSNHDPKLVILEGSDSGRHIPVVQPQQTLGRGPGVDLIMDDPTLSRQHAVIEFTDGGFQIRDLGSTNGVLLNGEAVNEAAIRHGDRIEMGGQVFQFLVDEKDDTPDTYVIS